MSNTEFRGSMCLSSTNKYKLSEDAVKINAVDNYFSDYKPLLFWHASEEWKTQPLKFNHTMWTSVNAYSGYATPSTQIYPISIVDGHNIITFEHNAKKLYELVEQNGFFPNCILHMIEFLCCYRRESVKLLKEYYEFFMTNIIEPNKEAILM